MERIIDLSIRVAHLETLKSDVDYLKSQTGDYNDQFKFLYKALNDFMTNFKELRDQNEILEVKIKTFNDTLYNLTQENTKLKNEIVELKKQVPPRSIVRR